MGIKPPAFKLNITILLNFLLHQQVPLPVPCVNFTQILHSNLFSIILVLNCLESKKDVLYVKNSPKTSHIWTWIKLIFRAWWAVCAESDFSFTVTCYFTITNDFPFMFSSFRKQSELGRFLEISSSLHFWYSLSPPL